MKKWMLSFILAGILFSQSTISVKASGHTESLGIVFWNSLWGAAIGAPVGLSIWALQNKGEEEIFYFMARGAAFGVLAGIGYGFYEVNRLGGFAGNPQTKQGLVHYKAKINSFEISLPKVLPYLTLSNKEPMLESVIFSADF